MAKEINDSGIGIEVNNKKIAILLYADDIVIITTNAQDLKKGMKIATNFGRKWRCHYNRKKTQVVVFGKKSKEKHNLQFGFGKIEQVKSYKYLGIKL